MHLLGSVKVGRILSCRGLPLIRSALRRIIQLIGGLGAGLAITLMVLAWQLSSGPVSIGLLTPYLEKVVNSEQLAFKIVMDDTILTWAGWDRALDIRVVGVKVLRPDGVLIGSVPAVSFTLSGQGLISGLFVPQSIELFRPRLKIIRDQKSIDIGFTNTNKKSKKLSHHLLDQLLAEPDPNNPMSYLTKLEIVNAEVTLQDKVSGRSWIALPANALLKRDKVGIVGDIRLALNIDGRNTDVATSIGYQSAARRIDLMTKFSDVSPAVISSMFNELEALQALALPIHGTFSAGMSLDGNIEAASFNLTGGRGKIIPSGKFAQSLSVEGLKLKGRYEGAGEALDIDEFFLDLGSEGSVLIPSKGNHRIPLSSIRGKGRYLGNIKRLDVNLFDLDLRGPTATIDLVVKDVPSLAEIGNKSITMDIKGSLNDLPVNQLAMYWPSFMNEDSRRWALDNLTEGMIHQIRTEGIIQSDGETIRALSIDGDIDLSGASVQYLSSMPTIRETKAYIKFDKENFNVFISGGHSENLKISQTSVLISGLDKYDQIANITVNIDGTLEDKLAYLNRKPLEYVSALGIDTKTIQGLAETELKLNFIVENKLTLDDIQISSQSRVIELEASNIIFGNDIKDGEIKVEVDKEGMDVFGRVKIGTIPLDLTWRENFNNKGSVKRVYKLIPHISDMAQIKELGLGVGFLTEKYINGSLAAEINYTIFTDVKQRLQIDADLSNTEILAPAFGWSKIKGIPGKASVTLDFKEDLIVNIPKFSVDAADLKVRGKVGFEKGGGVLKQIDFKEIVYGRTNIKGALIPRKVNGWDARFHGSSFELTPIWNDIFSKQSEYESSDSTELPYLNMAVELDRVWVSQNKSLNNISGTFIHKNDVWNTVLLKGEMGKGKPFELTIRPSSDGNRDFVMTTSEAGEALRLMGFYDEMQGGKMQIIGKYNDKNPDKPLIGKMNISDYQITDAPFLARVLSVMSLTGILDELEGGGLKFSYLEVPFIQGLGVLEIKDANASGTSIGFTGSGTIYTYADVMDISGTVIPAYVLNSALGHLPIIGKILTGGDKGSGVIAFNYSMNGPTDDPKITINPLSALTPGIFRNVFDFFGKEKNTDIDFKGGLQ
jgi:hypothetical protein